MKKLLVLLFTLFSVSIFAQDYIPNRPGYTYSAQSIGHKDLSVEMGFGYAYQYYSQRTDIYYNTTSVRYGIFKFMELSGQIDYSNINSKTYNENGISGVLFGTKVPIHINDSIIRLSLVGTCYLKDVGFQYTEYSPQLTLALQKNVGKFAFFGNVGSVWNAFDPELEKTIDYQSIASASIYYFPSDLGLFIESYHKFSKDHSYNNFDCGLVYIFSDNFIVDFSVGLNYKEWSDDSFINMGLAWRILNK